MTSLPDKLRKTYIHAYRELYRKIDATMRKTTVTYPGRKTPIHMILRAKLAAAEKILGDEMTRIIRAVEEIEASHPFYREIFRAQTGLAPGEAARKLRILRRNIGKTYSEYRYRLGREENPAPVFREAIGRLLSFYRRNMRLIGLVKKAVIEISKTPDVSGDLVVIIGGMPQVGKSTLIKNLTHAQPEIGSYPFTTRNIIVGHIVDEYGRITLVDTPGVLDRPLEKANPIERKAILSIKYLADKAIYLFDLSPQKYYSLEEQVSVYRLFKTMLGKENILPVINKMDTTDPDKIKGEIGEITREARRKPLLISALTGMGLGELRKQLSMWLREKNQSPQH